MSSKAKPASETRLQFGRRLAVVREAAGFETATDFAEQLGMSLATYSRYERGETEPNLSTLQRIHALTGVSLDFLVSGDLSSVAAQQPEKKTA